jgi:hypothetical protein
MNQKPLKVLNNNILVSYIYLTIYILGLNYYSYGDSFSMAAVPEVPGWIPGTTRLSESSGSGTGSTQPHEYN